MAFACCCFGKSPKLSLVEEDPEVDLGQLKRFSLRELQVATNGFSNKNFLARGAYGKVYKGRLEDASLVAIKRLEKEQTQGQQFQAEIKVTGITAHPNILRVCGFCITPSERLLVYSYMVNGSVASWLRDRQASQPPLDWQMRKRIALDSARGISYLHYCNPKIIHCNIKAAKIFLDEEFRGVVGGYGWAKLIDRDKDEASTIVCGTVGYIAPEYLHTGRCSDKTDVHAYGMMLLEIITGQKPFDLSLLANNNDLMLLDWVKGFLRENKLDMLVDSNLHGDYIEAELEELIQIALICTQSSPEDRPRMSEVVRLLEGNGLEERWNEYKEREIRRDKLDSNPCHGSRWSFDSAESLFAEDLPSPR